MSTERSRTRREQGARETGEDEGGGTVTPLRTAAVRAARGPGGDAQEGDPREEREGLTVSPPELAGPSPFELPEQFGTRSLDRAYTARLARLTLGITPFGLGSTVFTWWTHLMGSPGKQALLAEKGAQNLARLATFAATAAQRGDGEACVEPMPHDHRFDGEDWCRWPWNILSQSFLLTQQWWYEATNHIDGLSKSEENVVSFTARQLLDMAAPSNFLATNPEVARLTFEQGGANLVQGARHMMEDWEREISGKPPVGAEDFVPGRDLATAEGRVVYRNHLVELIQYAPTTDKVKAEPVLIVPAWIMKYYILDLSPHNSLVRWLVGQGYTVFILSWRNPTAEDRDLGMDDYLEMGVMDALDAVRTIVPGEKVHAIGYCIGGTLLATAAAAMARDGDERLATLTFFATQTDFTEAGELMLFVSESEVAFLENMMWDQGYLDTRQMAGAFQLLRSNDMIWSRYVREYLKGRRHEMFDLLAWNVDATRLPYRMHSEYLRRFFLQNELAQGKYEVDGAPVAIADIEVPVFSVSTTSDHIAPWRSVYKIHLLSDTEVTFVLTNGGHNAGIVSEPGHAGRRYSIRTTGRDARYLSPEAWAEEAEARDGSWWPALEAWLAERSSGETDPPAMGGDTASTRPREPAPGTYVFQK